MSQAALASIGMSVLALAACGAPEDALLDGGACSRPALDAAWLAPMLTDTVAQLAAAPRYTIGERAAARAYLAGALSSVGFVPTQQPFPGGANVYATVPATTGGALDELILGAHFDTVAGSPGANDNASGVAVVLAVARLLTETPCRPAPVTIVLFDAEEVGLLGSRAFAQLRDPATVRAVHTIDQVAWDRDGDARFELELPTAALEAQYRAAADAVGASVSVTSTQGTDHQPFRERGFAAVGLTEEYVGGDTSPHRHQPTDTPDTVDIAFVALAAQLTAQVLLDGWE